MFFDIFLYYRNKKFGRITFSSCILDLFLIKMRDKSWT